MAKRKLTLGDFQPRLSLDGRRVTVDRDQGRIAVRVANFGEVHSGFGPEVKVPRNANLDAAHVGTADLADGSSLRVAVLPMDTAHAPANLKSLHAASWYENSGKGVARGRYSADEHGIRFDGILFDDVTDAQADRLTAGSASGDWRSAIALKSFGDFEHAPADFVGSCLVNIGGYSDTYRQAPAERFALVASAAGDLITIEHAEEDGADMKWDGIDRRKKKTMTAGATDSSAEGTPELPEGCDGECTGCSCQGDTTPAPEGHVTITAAALDVLVAASAGAKDEEIETAQDQAVNALVAGGFRVAADSVEGRVQRLENELFIEREFNRQD